MCALPESGFETYVHANPRRRGSICRQVENEISNVLTVGSVRSAEDEVRWTNGYRDSFTPFLDLRGRVHEPRWCVLVHRRFHIVGTRVDSQVGG
jgi:hypothetical protein